MANFEVQWCTELSSSISSTEHRALVAKVPHATLFNSLEWVQSAAEELHEKKDLTFLTLRDQGQVVAWLPLCRSTETLHGLRVTTLRQIGYPYSDRAALLVAEPVNDLLETIWDVLPECGFEWDVLILNELYNASEQKAVLASAAKHSLVVNKVESSQTPVLVFGSPDPVALQAGYSKTLRTRIKRSSNKLGKAGAVEFERHLPGADEVEALVDECKRIEDLSWKQDSEAGIFGNPQRLAFFKAVAQRFSERGWLDIALLKLDGVAISYRFGFRDDSAFYDYNLAYDPAFAKFAPGRLLLNEIILSSQAAGLSSVDASRSSDEEPHLLKDWSDQKICHQDLWVFGRSAKGRMLSLLRRRIRPLAIGVRTRAQGLLQKSGSDG